jgi:hypothetical protein
MDPVTLFALANGAVSAVKAGCQLYKDIKSASGDIKGILKDLDNQFNNNHKDKPPTVPQRNAYIQEKNRVIELNKRDAEITGIYQEIGDYLSQYYDNMSKCLVVFQEQERKSREELYSGEDSLGKRAIQRVLMKKQLAQMDTELRELMVYQSPLELGALYTEVSEMMKKLSKEQDMLFTKQLRYNEVQLKRKRARLNAIKHDIMFGLICISFVIFFALSMVWVAYDRMDKYPQYGNGIVPRSPDKQEEKHIYIGR